MSEIEHRFRCPYCGERISCWVDITLSSQQYIEDCEVCCRPIALTYQSDGQEVTGFSAERAQ